jgi:tRNA C32,U32 (ribose-2'-O)-methylase TrmJ
LPTQLEDPAEALPWLLEAPSALIFGPEDCGLTNAQLNRAQRLIRIPSSDAYTSLNLAQAVAICCYELYREEGRRKKEEGRRKKEEGRRKKEEGRRKKEEGRRKKEEGRRKKSQGRSKKEDRSRKKKKPRSLAQPGNAYPEAQPLQYPMQQIIYQLVTKNNLQPARQKIPHLPSPVHPWKI